MGEIHRSLRSIKEQEKMREERIANQQARTNFFLSSDRMWPHSKILRGNMLCDGYPFVLCHADAIASYSRLIDHASARGDLSRFIGKTAREQQTKYLFLADAPTVEDAITSLSIEEVRMFSRELDTIASCRYPLPLEYEGLPDLAQARLNQLLQPPIRTL